MDSHRSPEKGPSPGPLPDRPQEETLNLAGPTPSFLDSRSGLLPDALRVLLRPAPDEGPDAATVTSEEVPRGPTGRYQLRGEIARGGMGVVVKARDTDLGRDLALKILLDRHRERPELIHRFIEEAQIGGQLQHPGIVPVYELGTMPGGRPFFSMKLVKGKTLAHLLDSRKDPAEDRARLVGIFEQVCQTLAYAHARGVIHRDLKPSNVMVGAFGEVQVMDWGLAKVLGGGPAGGKPAADRPAAVSVIQTVRSDGSSTGTETVAGSVLGTPAYMAPEQARGEVDLVDERADVFGLGAILCEILTGEPPFAGKQAEAERRAKLGDLGEALERLAGCGADGDLVGLARRCLAPEPWNRPPHAGEVAASVSAYLQSVERKLREAEVSRAEEKARAEEAQLRVAEERKSRGAAQARAQAERRARRTTVALAGTVIAALVAAGGGWWWVSGQSARRLDRLSNEIHGALERVAALREQVRSSEDLLAIAEARSEAARASALAVGEAIAPELRGRIEETLAALGEEERDRKLLAAIERARLESDVAQPGNNQIVRESALPAFRDAFRSWGLLTGEESPEAAAEKVRRRPEPARSAILAGLDDWLSFATYRGTTAQEPHLQWLRDLLSRADGDPWRQSFREALRVEEDRNRSARLLELAKEADFVRQPTVVLARLAVRLGLVGEVDTAVGILRRLWERSPLDFWVNLGLAEWLAKMSPPRLEEALRFATLEVALRPNSATAHNDLGHCLFSLKRLEEAAAEFRRAVKIQPELPMYHINLANTLLEQDKLDEALAACRKGIELLPPEARNAWAYGILGTVLHRQGKLEEAAAAYREAVRAKGVQALDYANFSSVLLDQEALDEALAACDEATRLDPDNAEAHNSRGIVFSRKGRDDEAIAEWRKCISLKPALAAAHQNLGNGLRRQGRLEEAIAAFRGALQVDPGDATAHGILGNALFAQGDAEGAIAAFRSAIRLKGDYAEARCDLGLALVARGSFAEGLRELRRGHELGSKQADWRFPSAEWIARAERSAALEAGLGDVITGKTEVRSPADAIAYADVAYATGRFAASAQLYGLALARQEGPEDAGAARYNGACSAVLAASGAGGDASGLKEEKRRELRSQALGWLRANLRGLEERLGKGPDGNPAEIRAELTHWWSDPDLTGIRDARALASLPAGEAELWFAFWRGAASLLARSGAPP